MSKPIICAAVLMITVLFGGSALANTAKGTYGPVLGNGAAEQDMSLVKDITETGPGVNPASPQQGQPAASSKEQNSSPQASQTNQTKPNQVDQKASASESQD